LFGGEHHEYYKWKVNLEGMYIKFTDTTVFTFPYIRFTGSFTPPPKKEIYIM